MTPCQTAGGSDNWPTTTNVIRVYPCDRGTGTPMGWHHYQANGKGVCCVYCGKEPSA